MAEYEDVVAAAIVRDPSLGGVVRTLDQATEQAGEALAGTQDSLKVTRALGAMAAEQFTTELLDNTLADDGIPYSQARELVYGDDGLGATPATARLVAWYAVDSFDQWRADPGNGDERTRAEEMIPDAAELLMTVWGSDPKTGDPSPHVLDAEVVGLFVGVANAQELLKVGDAAETDRVLQAVLVRRLSDLTQQYSEADGDGTLPSQQEARIEAMRLGAVLSARRLTPAVMESATQAALATRDDQMSLAWSIGRSTPERVNEIIREMAGLTAIREGL